MDTLFNLGLCISYDRVLDIYLHNWGTRSAITMRWKRLSVLLNSRVACSLMQLLTISTTIPVLRAHMTRSMELGYLSSNIQMMLSLGFSGMLLPFQVTLSEVPRERQLNCQTPTPMLHSDRFLPYHCLMDQTKQIVS